MTKRLSRRQTRERASQRGLSIVEFMVGTAIGLLVIGGGLKVFLDLFNNNRRQLVEVRLNQDLRAAADIIARDLRRSGYWANATLVVAPVPALNPFTSAAETTLTANQVTYAYDRDSDGTFTPTAERSGFQINNGAIEMRVGNAWQQLTDPTTVQITDFTVDTGAGTEQIVSRASHCPCVSSSGASRCNPAVVDTLPNRPVVVMRWANIQIQGRAAADNTVTRQVVESVRLRNDEVRGVCPPP